MGSRIVSKHVARNIQPLGVVPRFRMDIAHCLEGQCHDYRLVLRGQVILSLGQQGLGLVAFVQVPPLEVVKPTVDLAGDQSDRLEQSIETWKLILPEGIRSCSEEAVKVKPPFLLVADEIAAQGVAELPRDERVHRIRVEEFQHLNGVPRLGSLLDKG